jgi:acetylornithine/succinyldiaminopimelate/putrescine aminotransferase
MKITPLEAETLRRAAEVADAQMELVETLKRQASRTHRRTARASGLMIGIAFALFVLSSMTFHIWP